MTTDVAAPTQETVDRLVQAWLMLWNGSASDTTAAISPGFRMHAAMLDGGDGSVVTSSHALVSLAQLQVGPPT